MEPVLREEMAEMAEMEEMAVLVVLVVQADVISPVRHGTL